MWPISSNVFSLVVKPFLNEITFNSFGFKESNSCLKSCLKLCLPSSWRWLRADKQLSISTESKVYITSITVDADVAAGDIYRLILYSILFTGK